MRASPADLEVGAPACALACTHRTALFYTAGETKSGPRGTELAANSMSLVSRCFRGDAHAGVSCRPGDRRSRLRSRLHSQNGTFTQRARRKVVPGAPS